MAQKTKAQLRTQVDADINTNGANAITGEKVNDFLNDAIDSLESLEYKRTTFQVTPDDTYYPSEKLVKDSLNAEAAARAAADTTLQTNITAEATTRANADQDLQDLIDALTVLIDTSMKKPEAFAPSGSYPTTYDGDPIESGSTFRCAAGTMGTVAVNAEDLLIALIDVPGQTDANWQVIESNRDQATESVKGVGKVATQAVAEDSATTNDTDFITAKKWWQAFAVGLTLSSFLSAVRGTLLTGLSLASSAVITASDSIISAFGKLQAQITLRELLSNKDTDVTLAANDDDKYASQRATKTYADTKIPKSIGTTKGDIISFTASNTPIRKAVGSNGQSLRPDSTQSDGMRWANLGTLFAQKRSGVYYTLQRANGAPTTVALAANIAYIHPVFIDSDITLGSINFAITSAGTATKYRLVIWNSANAVPTTIFYDSGEISMSGTGLKTQSPNVAMPSGWYFVGVIVNGSVTVNAQTAAQVGSTLGVTISGTTETGVTYYQASITFTTPVVTDNPTVTNQSGNVPLIYISL